jgi:hypothetical protein
MLAIAATSWSVLVQTTAGHVYVPVEELILLMQNSYSSLSFELIRNVAVKSQQTGFKRS